QAGHSEADEGPYTVARALDDYFAVRDSRGSKGVWADRYAADARIVPELGLIEINKLTTKRIRGWHGALVTAPKLLRTRKEATIRATAAVDENDSDAVR